MLCLDPENYKEKKKNVKKNNFILFGFTMKNIYIKIEYN